MFGAEEALAIGLVQQVVPRELLAETVEALARRLLTRPATALRYLKDALEASHDLPLTEGLVLEQRLASLLEAGPAFRPPR